MKILPLQSRLHRQNKSIPFLTSWEEEKSRTSRVEIALEIDKPIGVAEYQLLLPNDALQTLIVDEQSAEEANNQRKINQYPNYILQRLQPVKRCIRWVQGIKKLYTKIGK